MSQRETIVAVPLYIIWKICQLVKNDQCLAFVERKKIKQMYVLFSFFLLTKRCLKHTNVLDCVCGGGAGDAGGRW